MTRQMLIYEAAEPVSSEAHRDLCVAPVKGFGFAGGLNSLPILAAEFQQVVVDAPIVFAGKGEAMTPAVLLGLRDGQNLFVDSASGTWNGQYVPAFLRRYPFIFSSSKVDKKDRLSLCIDTKFSGVNREGRGERLFDSKGERSQYLEKALAFTAEYQKQHAETRGFVARLQALDLMETASLTATMPDGTKLSLSGFSRVDMARLHALPEADVMSLFQSRALQLIYLHLASLGQMQALLKRHNAGTQAATARP